MFNLSHTVDEQYLLRTLQAKLCRKEQALEDTPKKLKECAILRNWVIIYNFKFIFFNSN